VENYRNYKSNLTTLKLAQADFSDLQNMVKDAKANQSNERVIEMDYTLRRSERELNMITSEVRKYRQTLVDLAGVDAVAKLDKQMDEENLAMDPSVEEAIKEQVNAPGDVVPVDAMKPTQADTADASKEGSAKSKVAAGDTSKGLPK
jgi:hypothetical protein